jgi:protein ImuB
LFLAGFPDPEKWELMLARLGNLVGEANVGSPELMDTHLQGEFRMDRFEIVLKEAELARNGKSAAAQEPATALRVFRPPFAARVELREECPVRIAFCGARAEVIAASGPWRTSGNWWGDDVWQHDEWDIEIRCDSVSAGRSASGAREQNPAANSEASLRDGMYRIYFDGLRRSWFVRGVYD